MIHIVETDMNSAWRKTFSTLYKSGFDPSNERYFRDEVAVIEISSPEVTPVDQLFPMPQDEIDVINHYIFTGEGEDKVTHEWTKLYYHRTFDKPNSQIEFLIRKLDANKPAGDAQVSMWDKNIDQDNKVSPCTQILWARIKDGLLEFHVHANSSDAYKKLLMNISEFISLQHYIAERVGVPAGRYYHFIDSFHLHNKDLEEIEHLYKQLNQN